MKKRFLLNQAMVNSIDAAFQHAGVYERDLRETDTRKKEVRQELSAKIRDLAARYAKPIGDVHHCSAIETLADSLSDDFRGKGVLRADRFRVGIAQKALNLYLKYLWCLSEISEPPHCPIDRRVIGTLSVSSRDRSQYNWTTLDSIEKYKILISLCRKEAGGRSIAEWELRTWKF